MEAGDVNVKLTADISEMTQAFADMRGQLGSMSAAMQSGSASSSTSLFGLGTAAVATGEILANLAQRAMSAASSLITFPIEAAASAGRLAEQYEQLS